MSERPTLSVLVPSYNHGRFLPECLAGILAQTQPPDEIIVLDDGSTDDSVAVVEEVMRRAPQMQLARHTANRGPVPTHNELLALAKGDYVLFTAADDVLLPNCIAEILDLLQRHPTAGICSGLLLATDEEGKDAELFPTPVVATQPKYLPPDAVRRLLLLIGHWTVGATTAYRRDALQEAGGFHPDLGSFCDSFAQQVLALRYGACFVPAPLSVWRILPNSWSSASLQDLEARRALVDTATAAMGAEHLGGLFPEGYVRRWRREAFLAAAIDNARRPDPTTLAERLNAIHPPGSLRERLALAVLPRDPGQYWPLTRALLFTRYLPVQVLTRRFALFAARLPKVRRRVDRGRSAFAARDRTGP